MSSKSSENIIFLRFYESNSPQELRLRSGDVFRGGIYPLEKNRFVLNLTCRAKDSPASERLDFMADSLIRFIGGENKISSSIPSGDWKMLTGVVNAWSDFYTSDRTRRIRNFYPVGDGVLCSNPIYGRGISFIVLQIQPLLELLGKQEASHEMIYSSLAKGFTSAFRKWSEIAGENEKWPFTWVRKYYLYLLEKYPESYEVFLKFYQLKITPYQLLTRLLLIHIFSITGLMKNLYSWTADRYYHKN